MKNQFWRASAILAVILAGCTSVPTSEVNRGVAAVPETSNEASPSILTVQPSNSFGIRLMREALNVDIANGKKQNTMTSPISAYLAFSIALNGSAGTTRAQLLNSLNMNLPNSESSIATVNSANKEMQKFVATERPTDMPEWLHPPLVRISNGVWNTNGQSDNIKFNFSKDFLSNIRSGYAVDYSLKTNSVDFRTPEASKLVNSWVDIRTSGMIKKIIGEDDLQDMLWVIINATYFEGTWAENFNLIEAAQAPKFNMLDGRSAARPMIAGTGHFRHIENGESEIVALPFTGLSGNAKKYVLYAVLPRPGSDFMSFSKTAWTDHYWSSVISDMKKAEFGYGSVKMPKFSFDYTVEMRSGSTITNAMELNYLFADESNFSAMATKDSHPSKVGLVKQSTRIELDEKGVKAAAVTLIGGLRSAAMPPRSSFNMVFDRPFIYAIAEETTGTLLFLGSVVDPK